MAMEYDWIEFKLNDALAGTLVGFKQSKTYDLSYTGELKGPGPIYKLAIGGYNLKVDQTGVVKEVTPSTDLSSKWVGKALQMVRTLMDTDSAVGSSVTRSSGSSGEGHSATAVLSTMEPRDHFAMNVLNAMLVHMESPEAKDDATMLKYSRAAYRWAQAMMIAAADSREGTSESTTPSTAVDIKSEDLQTNIEKLLYNMTEYMKKGIAIKGEPVEEGRATPVLTKLHEDSEIKEVKKVAEVVSANVISMPSTTHVTIDGTPNVSVTNTPNVNVVNMPTNYATSNDIDSAKDDIVDAIPSDTVKSSDITNAKKEIIDAMPQCKYTPPSNNGGTGGQTT